MKRSPELERARKRASEHLEDIAGLFIPGTKLTLLARQPLHPDGSHDFCLTDDDLRAVIAALEIRERESGGGERG
jgi:hypothetical protein